MRALRSSLFALVVSAFACVAFGSGCKEAESAKSVGKCAEACGGRAKRCSAHECHRGCTFVLDRLVENEGEHVLACVAASADKCDDTLWANCAVRVGEHADGGPPAPPPPPDDD